jgi:transcriptional regulator with XRE-family HTH domain
MMSFYGNAPDPHEGGCMNLYEYVGEQIRELRTKHGGPSGMSQEALAQKLGVATNTISRWETATYHPTLEDLERLAKFFGVSILSFLPNEDPDTSARTAEVTALLRATKDLDDDDLAELRQYAEFRRARHQLENITRRRRGRPKAK